jgi:putative ABC transport system ATP-binding protein
LSLIEVKNLYYSVENKDILKDISLDIEREDFISVVGPSGSGKSSLLKILGDLISPSKGSISYKGKEYKEYNPLELRRQLAYIRQEPYLFESTVRDNLEFPYTIRKTDLEMERIEELFSEFNMPISYLDRDVINLSGGEKQRISIMRSLIFEPEVLLLDEITSALDVENVELVENFIKKLHDKGICILWVTHNIEQSRKYANKICKVFDGEIESVEVIR